MKYKRLFIEAVKTILLGLALAALPQIASADGGFVCNPTMSAFDCFQRIYSLSLVAGAIGAVFMIAVAGYLYMFSGGSERNVGKAKELVTASISGLVILLAGFLILRQINPDLLAFRSISPEQIAAQDWLTPDGTIYRGTKPPVGSQPVYGGRSCNPTPDPKPSSINNLNNSCFAQYGPDVVRQASIVANRESGGNASLPVGVWSCGAGKAPARCTGGEIPVWGLFQINITAHRIGNLNCPAAFSDVWTCSRSCTVINPSLYEQCKNAALNPTNNINTACSIYAANKAAGRPGFNDWGNVRNEHGRVCGF